MAKADLVFLSINKRTAEVLLVSVFVSSFIIGLVVGVILSGWLMI